MQWADEGLLDFLEYLLEWSRSHQLFVLVLARPELGDKRASWGAGKRSFASLYLEPLTPQAMSELLTGLVPGLPEDLRDRILERSEGVPLYAVETVRMLIDRGLLVQEGRIYRPAGPVDTLEVPETLHALVAARLDSLTADERRLVQDAAVLGKTFTKPGLLALDGVAETELDSLLAALLRKEIVSIQADPRSPERGQYSFLQDLLRHVAYETLSRYERKAKHVAAAEFLSRIWSAEEDEIVEVVAAHYLDAYEAAPQDDDAEAIRAKAREMVVRAGERAASLAANTEAQRAFERAIELTDDPLVQASLHERAGVMALAATRADDAVGHFERSIELNEASGATHPAARVSAELAVIMWDRGRIEHGLEILDRSFEILSREEPDADLAELAAQIGRFKFFAGERAVAFQRIETALEIAEALSLPEILSQALNTKSVILMSLGRKDEGLVLLRHALDVALEHDKPSAALRAYYNLADTLSRGDQYEEAHRTVTAGLALARRAGNRYWEWLLLGQGYPSFAVGHWDDALAVADEVPQERWTETRQAIGALLSIGVAVRAHRGQLDEGAGITETFAELVDSADEQERASFLCGRARLLLARGEAAEALPLAESAFAVRETMGVAGEYVKEAFVAAVEAALVLGDTAKAEELLGVVEALPPGRSSHFLHAQTDRFRARLARPSEAPARPDDLFKRAASLFNELPFPFYAAVTKLEHAEWLVGEGRAGEAEPLLAEAGDVFEQLQAAPWLARVRAATAGSPQPLPVA
jgi:tetratricopeptide (TPR) repeat protein